MPAAVPCWEETFTHCGNPIPSEEEELVPIMLSRSSTERWLEGVSDIIVDGGS